MTKFSYKINALWLLLVIYLATFSCTKVERSAKIKNELSRSDNVITITDNVVEEHKYIIIKEQARFIHTAME